MRAAIRAFNPARLPPCCSRGRRRGTRAGLTPVRNPCAPSRSRPAPGGRSGSSASAPVRAEGLRDGPLSRSGMSFRADETPIFAPLIGRPVEGIGPSAVTLKKEIERCRTLAM